MTTVQSVSQVGICSTFFTLFLNKCPVTNLNLQLVAWCLAGRNMDLVSYSIYFITLRSAVYDFSGSFTAIVNIMCLEKMCSLDILVMIFIN